jgi:hypothetical protein
MRAHASVGTQTVALVLEAIETSSLARVAPRTLPPIVIEPRVPESDFCSRAEPRASTYPRERSSELPPQLVETTTSASPETQPPPVSESWRVRAANKAYGAIAPEKAADPTPRCSRRC